MKLFCIKSCSQMVQVIRLQYVINSNLYQGMCSKQGPTLPSSACISGYVLSDKEQN